MTVISKAISEIVEVNPRIPTELSKDPKRQVDFVPMSQLSEKGYVTPNGSRPLTEVQKGYTYFTNGDVIVAKITPCMENGKAAFVDNLPHEIGFGSTEFHVLRPGRDVDGRYLFYTIWNSHFRHVAESNMTGSAGQKRVPTKFFDRFKIPLPPLSEQKRIADILDKADAIRRKRQEAIGIWNNIQASIFHDLFGDPIANPKSWEVRTLEDCCVPKIGIKAGPFGSALKKEFYTKAGYRVYGQEQVIAGTLSVGDYYIDDDRFESLKTCEVIERDLLISLVGSIGKTLIVPPDFEPGIINPRLLRIRTRTEVLNPIYLQYVLKQPTTQAVLSRSSHGGTMAVLNGGMMKALEFAVPDIEKQHEFERIMLEYDLAGRKINLYESEIEDLFNSLVQRAFKGEL